MDTSHKEFSNYDIVEVDLINNKSTVCDNLKNHFELPFSLEGYPSPIELLKLKKKHDDFVEFSLKSQINSKYKYGHTYTFKIKSYKTTKFGKVSKDIWEIEDENRYNFIVFVRQKDVRNYSIGQEIKCRVVKIYPNNIFLKFLPKENFYFIPGVEYKFSLVDAKTNSGLRVDLCILLIKDDKGNHYEVIGPSWQKKYKDKITEIYCVRSDEEENKLVQIFSKQKHPFFEENQAYDFVIKGAIENNENKIIVIGQDKCLYVINRPFIYHEKPLPTNAKLKLVYFDINNRFGNIKTKYFITFEDIIKNFRALKRITFDSFRKELQEPEEDSLITKLYSDYDSYENLWVISFCEVLRKKINSSLQEKDFEIALIFIDVLLQIEEWILNSGFLSSFSKLKREVTSKVAFSEIDSLRQEYKALELILDNKEEAFIKDNVPVHSNGEASVAEFSSNMHVLLYVYKHIEFADRGQLLFFFETINNLGKSGFLKVERTASEITLEILEEKKNYYHKKLFYGVFINSEKRRNYFTNNDDLLDYVLITLASLLISIDIENKKGVIIYAIRFLNLMSLYISDTERQNKIISIAINLSSSRIINVFDAIKNSFSWNDCVNKKFLQERPIHVQNSKFFKNISDLEKSLNESSFLRVRVTGNSWIGYEVNYKEDSLFLPFYNTQRAFKKGEALDVIVYQLDKQFNHALVKVVVGINEIPDAQVIEVGSYVRGIVKKIEDYGVFVKLGTEDGLIPKKEVSTQFIAHPEDILNVGDVIETKVLNIEKDADIRKTTLSRKEYLLEKIKSIPLDFKTYEATITNIVEQHGIFIELKNGHSGLIRREEIIWNDVEFINDLYSNGDKLNVDLLYTSGEKSFFSLLKNKIDPFTDDRLVRKKFSSRVVSFKDFDKWLNFYSIEDKPHVDFTTNALTTYCPFCYEKSPFKTYNYKKLSNDRSIEIGYDKKKWKCKNCNYYNAESLELYIPEINCTVEYYLDSLSTREYSKIKNTTNKKDVVELTIRKLNKRFRYFDVEVDLTTFKKGNLQTKYGVVERLIGYEIAGCYEQYAFQLENFDERVNYLNWAKYYYGVSKSPKSYYLSAYTNYINLVNSAIKGDKLRDDVLEIVDRCKILISEIELQSSILENFPVLEKVILLLKVISNIKATSIESYNFLLTTATSDSDIEHEYIRNLAAAILSYNLVSDDTAVFLFESLKERIVLLMKRSLSSFANSELDSDEINKRILLEKFLASGEGSNLEFKATIDVPVLSKERKLAIANEHAKLESTTSEDERKNLLKQIKELSIVNSSDRKLVDIVNLSAIKTIAAFANTSGGYLIIGVDEDEYGNPFVSGLDPDLKKHKNRDGIKLRIDSLFQKYFGNGMVTSIIRSMDFIPFRGKEILLIDVNKCTNELFVNTGEEKKFYIRRQASTAELKSYELYEYLKGR